VQIFNEKDRAHESMIACSLLTSVEIKDIRDTCLTPRSHIETINI
jgi:hypothetical protein